MVVETSVTPEQGAVTGTSISCSDQQVEGPSSFFLRMYCGVAEQLREGLKEEGAEVVHNPFWMQVKTSLIAVGRDKHDNGKVFVVQITDYYRGEQLAYITAFATGAKLVFGDRPKDITFR